MPYSAEISRANPACICLLLDQSGSMADSIAGSEKRKCDFLADAVNRILENLSVVCAKGEEIRDYFDLFALGYGATVQSAFAGPISGRDVVSISVLANNPARVESRTKKVDDGAGGLVEQQVRFPVWVDAQASGGTPMCAALSTVLPVLSQWTSTHKTSFPPVVIHFTDGESTDGDPSDLARQLMSIATSDGQALLFNGHISARGGQSVVFPATSESLPDQFATLLYNMSSALPPKMSQEAQHLGFKTSEGSRGFVYNAHAEHIVGLLEIGTRPSNLR
jgi:hypothetical protein